MSLREDIPSEQQTSFPNTPHSVDVGNSQAALHHLLSQHNRLQPMQQPWKEKARTETREIVQ